LAPTIVALLTSMRFFLVRHGQDDFYLGKESRGLGEARKAAVKISRFRKEAQKPISILSSPIERALQTAHIIARELNITQIDSHDLLLESATPTLDDLENILNADTIRIVVTHMPTIQCILNMIDMRHAMRLAMPTGCAFHVDTNSREIIAL